MLDDGGRSDIKHCVRSTFPQQPLPSHHFTSRTRESRCDGPTLRPATCHLRRAIGPENTIVAHSLLFPKFLKNVLGKYLFWRKFFIAQLLDPFPALGNEPLYPGILRRGLGPFDKRHKVLNCAR